MTSHPDKQSMVNIDLEAARVLILPDVSEKTKFLLTETKTFSRAN
jgi:hypothetical protein